MTRKTKERIRDMQLNGQCPVVIERSWKDLFNVYILLKIKAKQGYTKKLKNIYYRENIEHALMFL